MGHQNLPARKFPFVWVTWLTKLLAGEDQCEYALWVKARYDFKEKHEDTANVSTYAADHAEAVKRRAAFLSALPHVKRVKVETQNKFFMHGNTLTISGCPDITYVDEQYDPEEELVEDIKTGKKRHSDLWQVRLYLFTLPLLDWWRNARRPKPTGAVVYPDERQAVPMLAESEQARILSVLAIVQSVMPPQATPSPNECKWCKVLACDYRSTEEVNTGRTTLF